MIIKEAEFYSYLQTQIRSEAVKHLFVSGCSEQVHIEFSITQSDGHNVAGAPRKTPPRSGPERLHTAHSAPANKNLPKQTRSKVSFPHTPLQRSRGTTRFRKVEGKLDRFSRGKLSVVYCVITWTCLPRRDSRNLGRKDDMLRGKGFYRALEAVEKRPAALSAPSVIFFDRKHCRTLLQFLFLFNSISPAGS